MESPDPDRELVERAQVELPYGTTSYNRLVRRHSDRVFRRCFRILRSEPDAREVSQDVFVAVFRNLGRFHFEKPFSHWLDTVTLNACRMQLRKRSREQRKRDALEIEPQPPTSITRGDPLLRKLVGELLDEIDVGTRIPLLMHAIEGKTYAEIARELDIGESAAKMRVSRGTKRLRELYEARRARANETEPETSDG